MHLKRLTLMALATFCLAACGDQQGDSMGSGPGNADGIGGREDPPAATTDEAPNNSSTTDPAGAMTTPDGSTQDTGATPRDPQPGNQGQ